jgi:hypothetical protein
MYTRRQASSSFPFSPTASLEIRRSETLIFHLSPKEKETGHSCIVGDGVCFGLQLVGRIHVHEWDQGVAIGG